MKKASLKWRMATVLLALALAISLFPMTALSVDATVVYLNGSAGDDANSGADADNAVRTLDKAMELAGTGGTIVLCTGITLNNAGTVNLSGVTFQRASTLQYSMFNASGSTVLSLTDVTIDGGQVAYTYDYGHLIELNQGATLEIGENAHLINNMATAISALNQSVVKMTGGSIKNNVAANDGGAIYLWQSQAQLTGGVIEGNSTERGGGGICALSGSTITLNGTRIQNNTASTGGGIYLEGQNDDSRLDMQSGSITGNTCTDYGMGGGITLWYGGADTLAVITGGTISGNITEDDYGSAMLLSGNGNGYPRLQLSGAPAITDSIYFFDVEDDGPVIEVTAGLTVAKPITLMGDYGSEGTTAVTYANGLTPDATQFVSQYEQTGLRVEGQHLQWVDLIDIAFKTEDNRTTYKRVYVAPNDPIDPAEAPTPTKEGYTLVGWRLYGSQDLWDFENDVVTVRKTLLATWALNDPVVSLSADKTEAHPGERITLRAEATHDVSGATYTYAWYKDGLLLQGETEQTLSVTESGSYAVKVIASDGTLNSKEMESAPVVCTVGHSWGQDWQSDATHHWHACLTCGEKVDVAAHTSDAGTVTTPATQTQAGVRTFACTMCGKVLRTETIPAIGSPTPTPTTPTGTPTPAATPSTSVTAAPTTTPTPGPEPADGTAGSPRTGDTNPAALFAVLLALAGGGLMVAGLYRRRKNEG